jgi:hypothetical protein
MNLWHELFELGYDLLDLVYEFEYVLYMCSMSIVCSGEFWLAQECL